MPAGAGRTAPEPAGVMSARRWSPHAALSITRWRCLAHPPSGCRLAAQAGARCGRYTHGGVSTFHARPDTSTSSESMSDGEQPELPDAGEQTGGLRGAMETRVKALQEAEDRIRREQAALQEQAKVVFAERGARLARRERELAKREAALAVSEGIAAGAPLERDKQLEEREEAMRAREQALEQLQAELDARAAQPAE